MMSCNVRHGYCLGRVEASSFKGLTRDKCSSPDEYKQLNIS